MIYAQGEGTSILKGDIRLLCDTGEHWTWLKDRIQDAGGAGYRVIIYIITQPEPGEAASDEMLVFLYLGY